MIKRFSLRWRMLSYFLGTAIIVIVLVLAGLSFLLRNYTVESKTQEIAERGNEMAQLSAGVFSGDISREQLTTYFSAADPMVGARIWLLDNQRCPVVVSRSPQTPLPPSPPPDGDHHNGMSMMNNAGNADKSVQRRESPFRRAPELEERLNRAYAGESQPLLRLMHPYYDEQMLIGFFPVRAEGKVAGVLILAAPVQGIDTFLYQLYAYVILAGAVGALVAILAAFHLSGKMARPLLAMQENAARMAAGDYSGKLDVTTNDEVGDLAGSLNKLAADLSAFVEKMNSLECMRRDFVANVSHELRTPLTIIRGYNEAMLDGTVTDEKTSKRYQAFIRDEVIRLERLIHELLDISRLQSQHERFTETIDFSELVEQTAQHWIDVAQKKEVNLQLQVEPGLRIQGNGDRLVQLLVILLDNALRFTPGGAAIELSLTGSPQVVTLVVADQGCGIAPADLPYIWERFYKTDKSHTRVDGGTGLGLSIAKEIIERHEGSVEVASELTSGTTFTMRFPKLNS